MNSEAPRTGLVNFVAILGSFLVIGALAWAIYRYTQPAPLGEDKAATRARTLAQLRADEADAMTHVAWIDPSKGIVRLRVEDAMNLVLREWQNPPAARSNLLARLEQATAQPPKAPAAPSQFE